jgi:alginate O-acetyltransferase complex protein AlgI
VLFNSYSFLFGFLPAVLLAFAVFNRLGPRTGVALLSIASLVFYGWWNPVYLLLMCASIVFNFAVAQAMYQAIAAARRHLLVFGVLCDLAALAYFKYAGFFAGIVDALSGRQIGFAQIALPLGISFFTFTQIAFLVDSYRDEPSRPDFLSYLLFVTFFPHLIAGPIYHHKEMLPQFARLAAYRFYAQDLVVGATIFAFGLFKKTVFADSIAPYADHVYAAAANGATPGAIEAWCGTLAFALQIYFDFSGYSDMAIGLARLFGIALPLNFASPYKSRSIVEFWRRWHMSLSRFLRDYLYIPLGGSRHGEYRTQINLGITMVLGGLWHGANWTFVAWGAAHGVMLMANHGWRRLFRPRGNKSSQNPRGAGVPGVLLTFVCVLLAWVLFRAGSLAEAERMYSGMAGMGVSVATSGLVQRCLDAGAIWGAGLLLIVWLAPNTQQIMGRYGTALRIYHEDSTGQSGWPAFAWRPDAGWAVAMAAVSVCAVIAMSESSRFLYFQF